MKKIVTIVGARPQFIKAATVSRVIIERGDINEVLIHTGQHFDSNMSDVFFEELDIRPPDINLGIGGGSHGQNTGRMIESIEKSLLIEKPDWVLVYGDTDSTLAGTLAAVKLNIPIAHVEAGLRSFNRHMPEEVNRILTDHAASLLFVPTKTAADNLVKEGIAESKIKMVGDVMYDATLYYLDRAFQPASFKLAEGAQFFLCTIHRAENTNNLARLKAIVKLLNELAENIPIILPLHPRTKEALNRLQLEKLSHNIKIINPVTFLEMNWLLSQCEIVLTDSGGVQKEAYFHRKPCITLRDETEWIELVASGWNHLVSPLKAKSADIITFSKNQMSIQSEALYGDGMASYSIVDHLNNSVIA
jgi:UDP-GlcNAc3NAcA epimerase